MEKIELILNLLAKYEDRGGIEQILNYYQNMAKLLNESTNFNLNSKNFQELSTKVDSVALMDLIKELNISVSENIDSKLKEAKSTLFINLLKGNFPTKKHLLTKNLTEFEDSLNHVEKSIFENIRSFISHVTLAIEVFLHFSEFDIEKITAYINGLHETIIDMIFNDVEKEMLSENLKQVSVIYLTLYASVYQK